ncbi:MAG TPA: RpiB/LacA/LacB family sugar-phosphate isomerase [Tepidisphaeraceae bacterium]|nr:RpiB/LacA/LacB family sugar-phosphate isomerase [Tepidisphaeraceae bacterium]
MKVAIASDHRGFDAKRKLVMPILQKVGHELVDFGCNSGEVCDYPDFAAPAARAVARGECDIGILLDGTGIGMSIVANKIAGVCAALAHDDLTARVSREKNHCNVLCLPADLISEQQIRAIVDIFLNTECTDGRHTERVRKIQGLERGEW